MFPYSGLRHRNALWFVKTMVINSSCFCNSKIEKQTVEGTQHTLVPCTPDFQTPFKWEDAAAEESTWNQSHTSWAVTCGTSTLPALTALTTVRQETANLAQSPSCQIWGATAWADCPQKLVQAFWSCLGRVREYFKSTGWTITSQCPCLLLGALISSVCTAWSA